jgi:hypothetical protein
VHAPECNCICYRTAPRDGPHYDEFSAALRQLDGHSEHVVRGRYVEHAALGEAFEENPEAARLGRQINGEDQVATELIRQFSDVASQADADFMKCPEFRSRVWRRKFRSGRQARRGQTGRR